MQLFTVRRGSGAGTPWALNGLDKQTIDVQQTSGDALGCIAAQCSSLDSCKVQSGHGANRIGKVGQGDQGRIAASLRGVG